jgi:hypothetical protein
VTIFAAEDLAEIERYLKDHRNRGRITKTLQSSLMYMVARLNLAFHQQLLAYSMEQTALLPEFRVIALYDYQFDASSKGLHTRLA